MLDAKLRPLIDPPLNSVGRVLARIGVSANMLTFSGLALGLGGAVAIAQGQLWLGLALIIANRLLDGLDGAVARATQPTALGGYFDIVADFAFYVSVPLGFGILASANTLPALVLVASFVLTGVSFLAFAVVAAERGEETQAHGKKSFFYSTGLAEGGETIAVFIAMCLLPAHFAIIAYLVGRPDFSEYLGIPHVPGAGELAIFCAAIMGGGLAFLWFNAPPAAVFMGDTGSLALGGALGAIAVASHHEVVLAIVGGLFVLEALSVIIQVFWFKRTGKRVFRMAPIHHHFEQLGWSESKVVIRFWIIAIVLALAGLATLKLR